MHSEMVFDHWMFGGGVLRSSKAHWCDLIANIIHKDRERSNQHGSQCGNKNSKTHLFQIVQITDGLNLFHSISLFTFSFCIFSSWSSSEHAFIILACEQYIP